MPPEAVNWIAAIVGTVVGTISLGIWLKRIFTKRRQRRAEARDEEAGTNGIQLTEMEFGEEVDEWGLRVRRQMGL
ncbi:hypothetical protein N7527_010545 [Penicillium freii]|nr:hypothetical protein N7527_010545 [Penicillium freii]